jgi:hypothetical protein
VSWGAAAVVGGSIVGGLLTSKSQSKAASKAADAQTQASQAGIEAQLQAQQEAIAEQRRQFDTVQSILSPFVEGGRSALAAQQALIGLAGPQAQQAAIAGIQASPEYGALTRAGEEAILANASATGGLRGGNVQGALAEFRPQVLSSLINQQYDRLGGLTATGQASAAGQAQAAQLTGQNVSSALLNTGADIAGLQGQIGAARAGSALASGQAQADFYGGLTGAVGTVVGMGGFGSNAPRVSPRPVARPF